MSLFQSFIGSFQYLVLLDQVLAGPGHLPHLRLAQGETAGGRERTGVERHLD